MKALIFLLLLNQPNGAQTEIIVARDLTFEQCDLMQRNVWNAGAETIGRDAEGPIPAYDAACVYPVQLVKVNVKQ
jgi:hypothetical protein